MQSKAQNSLEREGAHDEQPFRVLLSHPRGGGGVNSGTHPPRILAYPQTDKCPTPPQGGGGGLTPTHPPTHPSPFMGVGQTQELWGSSVTPSTPAQSTNNPSPFMGVGQRQELWGSSVTPSASGTKHKQS